MSQDENYSAHYDEFRARVDSYRSAGGEIAEVVWTAILDLGHQVSIVRHEIITMAQANENLDAKLFGWQTGLTPDFAEGGVFGSLLRKMDEAQRASEATVLAQTAEMKDDLVWLKRILGVFVTIGTAVVVYLVAHQLHIPGI